MDHDNDVVNNVCSMNFLKNLFQGKKGEQGSELATFWTEAVLQSYLLEHGIPFEKWEEGAIDRLLAELQNGVQLVEMDVADREGALVWIGVTVSIRVSFTLNEEKMVLGESKRVSKTLGTSRTSAKAVRVGVTLLPNENPEKAAIRQLNAMGVKGEIGLQFQKTVTGPPATTKTYPGLLRQYLIHKMDIELNPFQYREVGYSELDKEKGVTVHYEWKKDSKK